MNRFERFFRDNRSDFDNQSLQPHIWEGIEKGLQQDRMSARRKIAFSLAAGISLLLASFLLLQPDTPQVVAVRNQCPDIVLPNINGKQTALSCTDSKVVLVNFWASWDEVCNENNCYVFLPIYEKYKDKGFEIYGIAMDQDRETWVNHIKQEGLPWIEVSDLKGWDSPVVRLLNVESLPTSLLLDENLNIIARNLDAESLEHTLSDLLAFNN